MQDSMKYPLMLPRIARLLASPHVVTPAGAVNFEVRQIQAENKHIQEGKAPNCEFTRTMMRVGDHDHVHTVLRANADMQLIRFEEILQTSITNPSYTWTPQLCPQPQDVVADHAFRGPLVILHEKKTSIAVAPNLDVLAQQRSPGEKNAALNMLRMYMDLRFGKNDLRCIHIGLAGIEPRPHVYFQLTGQPISLKTGDTLVIAFDIFSDGVAEASTFLRRCVSFIWDRYAKRYKNLVLPQILTMNEYATIAMEAAEETEFVDFQDDSGRAGVGFCVFKNKPATSIEETYFKVPDHCVWYHTWFNDFRAAFGLKYFGEQTGRAVWVERANKICDWLLSSPDASGFGLIPSLYDYEQRRWWCGVTRLGAGENIYQLSDSAQTAMWMILWHRHLSADQRCVDRATRIAQSFVDLQNADGSYPAYLHRDGQPLELLNSSAQSGMISQFLCVMYELDRNPKWLQSAQRACDFFIKHVIPTSQYHDFETFFSCSPKPLDFYDHRTGQHAQNSLCLSWIADTLLRITQLTGRDDYRKWALRCVDALSLYQQVWNPPYISLYTFGGFGVMNTDGEWNDQRQVQFADIYFRACEVSGLQEYEERGTAALRAGFALFCHPSHSRINPKRYNAHRVGVTPENYGHEGYTDWTHVSGFTWGSGAMLTAVALLRIRFGKMRVGL